MDHICERSEVSSGGIKRTAEWSVAVSDLIGSSNNSLRCSWEISAIAESGSFT